MAVILLNNASLDKSSSAESENSSGSGTTNTSTSTSTSAATRDSSSASDSSNSNSIVSGIPGISSSLSSNESSSKENKSSSEDSQHIPGVPPSVSEDSSTNGSKASKSSFNLLHTIKLSSNSINREFKKRVNQGKEYSSNGSIASIATRSTRTFTTITESLSASSEELSEAMSKTIAMFTGSQPHDDSFSESPQEYDEASFDLDEDDEEYDWTAVAVPKSFINPSQSMDSDRDSPLHSLSSDESDIESLDGGEDESRDVSLLDNSASQDEESDSDSESETYSLKSSDSIFYDEFTEMDALATLGGVVYQIGSCNFQDLKVDFDDDYSVEGDNFRPNAKPTRTAGTANKRPPQVASFLQQLGFAEDSKSPRAKAFFQSMFSCGGK